MLTLFYEIALWFLALVSLPKVAYDYYVRKKYRQSLGNRFGLNFPLIDKGQRKLIWIHAVSVGETKAITALVKTMHNHLDNPVIVISSVTETGHAEAKRTIPQADYYVYLPLDFRFIIRPIVKRTNPDLVVLSETDFWYNFLKSAKDAGAKIALVNGKMSERSFCRLKKLSMFSHRLLSFFDLLCIQSKHYIHRFKDLDVDPEKLKITGNLKFDDEYPPLSQEQRDAWKTQFQIGAENKVIVVGSSHEHEETLILEQMNQVWKMDPDVKLMIVPRHPERFNTVADILEKENVPYMRFSQIYSSNKEAKVILIDAMGLLRKCYQLADIAIVAGSYTSRVGGHNILEPSCYGIPVIYGPYMQTQPELVELMQSYGAGLQIPIENLGSILKELLDNDEKRKELGQCGLSMLQDVNGATKRTWDLLKQLVIEK